MADVFVSYKKQERAKAEAIVAALQSAGYSVWWDEDLTPRTSWDAEIEREIAAAKAVLVLWSPKAADERSFVRLEAGYALDHGKLAPAFVERCTLPLRYRDVQTADLSRWDLRDAAHPEWRRALNWIAALVGRAPVSARVAGGGREAIREGSHSQDAAQPDNPLAATSLKLALLLALLVASVFLLGWPLAHQFFPAAVPAAPL
jgi:hypothetical protein